MASRSPQISVEVVAGQVAGVVSFHPGPPGIGLYPLLNTAIDNEVVMLTPSFMKRPASEPPRVIPTVPSPGHRSRPGNTLAGTGLQRCPVISVSRAAPAPGEPRT